MTKNAYIAITRTVFGAVTLMHLIRFLNGWSVQFGSVSIPIWASIAVVFLTGILSSNGFTLNEK